MTCSVTLASWLGSSRTFSFSVLMTAMRLTSSLAFSLAASSVRTNSLLM